MAAMTHVVMFSGGIGSWARVSCHEPVLTGYLTEALEVAVWRP